MLFLKTRLPLFKILFYSEENYILKYICFNALGIDVA